MNPNRVDFLIDLAYGVLIFLAIVLILVVGTGIGVAFGLGALVSYVIHVAWKMARFDPEWMTREVTESLEETITEEMGDDIEETITEEMSESVEVEVAREVAESVEETLSEELDSVVDRLDDIDDRLDGGSRGEGIEARVGEPAADREERDDDERPNEDGT